MPHFRYWKEVFQRRGLTRTSLSGYEEDWLALVFGEAQTEIEGVHGGLYWEVEMDFKRLYDALLRLVRGG